MPFRSLPFDPVETSGRRLVINADDLHRMGQQVQVGSPPLGPGFVSHGGGTSYAEPSANWFFGQVLSADTSNPKKYAWRQVIPSGDGTFTVPPDAVAGTTALYPAYEANRQTVASFPVYALFYRSTDGGVYFYANAVASGGSGAPLTVAAPGATNGSGDLFLSTPNVTTIFIDQASGLKVIQITTGTVQVSAQPASTNHSGVVNLLTAQRLGAGVKSIEGLTVQPSLTAPLSVSGYATLSAAAIASTACSWLTVTGYSAATNPYFLHGGVLTDAINLSTSPEYSPNYALFVKGNSGPPSSPSFQHTAFEVFNYSATAAPGQPQRWLLFRAYAYFGFFAQSWTVHDNSWLESGHIFGTKGFTTVNSALAIVNGGSGTVAGATFVNGLYISGGASGATGTF